MLTQRLGPGIETSRRCHLPAEEAFDDETQRRQAHQDVALEGEVLVSGGDVEPMIA
jgi:hypothetical protein